MTGTATAANILCELRGDDPAKASEGDGPEIAVPWRKEVAVRARGDGVYVNLRAIAAGPKGFVMCRITANGTVIDEDLEGEAYTSCSGNANTDAVPPILRSIESSSAPSGPPPNSDLIPELVLPAGSTAVGHDPDGTRESCEMTVPYADAVKVLRAQLPISSDYHGLRWCGEHVESELTMWTWGDKNDLLFVLVDGAVRTGSRVAITHKGPSLVGC